MSNLQNRTPITIEVLTTLDAIDRRGSFAKAAMELNKATSAVSYSVQKLEEQLAITLFQRQGRRSVLTPAGRLILEGGREILHSTHRLAQRAQELANGWEPSIKIAIESFQAYPQFFTVINTFLERHPSIEIDIRESVLNGGWEALAQDKVALIVGSPGPVPQQKGYRTVAISAQPLVPVIAAKHPYASIAGDKDLLAAILPSLRRVITHDTSQLDIARSAGLSNGSQQFFVQNIDQKIAAISAGIGIGHLPRHRIQQLLDSEELLTLNLPAQPVSDNYLAWKLDNKGQGLQVLIKMLSNALC